MILTPVGAIAKVFLPKIDAAIPSFVAELADQARLQKEEDRKIAEAEKEEAKKQKEIVRFNQYVAEMNLVQREHKANNISHVQELLNAQAPRDRDETDFRGVEWYY